MSLVEESFNKAMFELGVECMSGPVPAYPCDLLSACMLQPSEEQWCIQELRDPQDGLFDRKATNRRDPSSSALQPLLLSRVWTTKLSQSDRASKGAIGISRCALRAIVQGVCMQQQQIRASAAAAFSGLIMARLFAHQHVVQLFMPICQRSEHRVYLILATAASVCSSLYERGQQGACRPDASRRP
jgi:hypothetical protein